LQRKTTWIPEHFHTVQGSQPATLIGKFKTGWTCGYLLKVKKATAIKPAASPKSPQTPHCIDRVMFITIVRADYNNEAGVIDKNLSSTSGSIEGNQHYFADI
jgi:hypothetical protein